MKTLLLYVALPLLTISCANRQFNDFSKRKYLRLGASENCETIPHNDSIYSAIEDSNPINSVISVRHTSDADESTEPSQEVTADVAFTTTEPNSSFQASDIIVPEFTPFGDLDDSLTQSGEDPVAYAIKDQLKIMNPYFKWSRVMLVMSLILAAALVTLFFVLTTGSLVAEVLYVLLIFFALFSIIGISSAVRSRISAKKLQGLSKDEQQLQRTQKVRNVTKWLVFFFILFPIAGLLGLVVYNNV